jgi:hypothetical protein
LVAEVMDHVGEDKGMGWCLIDVTIDAMNSAHY